MSGLRLHRETIEPGRTVRLTAHHDGSAVTWQGVIDAWQRSDEMCDSFSEAVREPFAACFWETRPITETTLREPFECVVVDSPALADVDADPSPFRRQLAEAGPDGIAVFDNLGGDAVLLAPAPPSSADAFPHLAAFLRTATVEHTRALWRAVGRAVARQLAGRTAPLWVSTSGLGVYWVHVRLDDRPKYYVHPPYRRPPGYSAPSGAQ